MKKFTVITVCLNVADDLKRTIESVMGQKRVSFEYIIKDGGSKDGTKDLVEEYIKNNNSNQKKIFFSQKKDDGIYDAMNQAVAMSGDTDYVIFLNAGDVFFDDGVLEYIDLLSNKVDILIGGTLVKMGNREIMTIPKVEKDCFNFYHQSVLVNTSLMKGTMFDLKYKIAADRDALLKMRKNGATIQILNMMVSVYSEDGYSAKNIDKTIKEMKTIDDIYGIYHKKPKMLIWKLRKWIFAVCPSVVYLYEILYCTKVRIE